MTNYDYQYKSELRQRLEVREAMKALIMINPKDCKINHRNHCENCEHHKRCNKEISLPYFGIVGLIFFRFKQWLNKKVTNILIWLDGYNTK